MLAEDWIVGDRQIKLISSPNSGYPAHMGLAVTQRKRWQQNVKLNSFSLTYRI